MASTLVDLQTILILVFACGGCSKAVYVNLMKINVLCFIKGQTSFLSPFVHAKVTQTVNELT